MNDNNYFITITVSPIVGTRVKTKDEEFIGEITGVVLDTKTGNSPYVVIELDPKVVASNRKHIMLSWEAIHSNAHQPQEFILDIDKKKLQNLPGFYSDCTSACSQYALEKSLMKKTAVATSSIDTDFLDKQLLHEYY